MVGDALATAQGLAHGYKTAALLAIFCAVYARPHFILCLQLGVSLDLSAAPRHTLPRLAPQVVLVSTIGEIVSKSWMVSAANRLTFHDSDGTLAAAPLSIFES